MSDIHFLREEKVVIKLRKHWLLLVRDTLGTALLALLPVVLMGILARVAPTIADAPGFDALNTYATALWLLIIWLALAVLWTEYYLDIWLVTNQRIISIDQLGLFNRKITSLAHDRIQEVIVKEENFLQALFHFGTLEIETASPTDGDATMHGIPHPGKVREIIAAQRHTFAESSKGV